MSDNVPINTNAFTRDKFVDEFMRLSRAAREAEGAAINALQAFEVAQVNLQTSREEAARASKEFLAFVALSSNFGHPNLIGPLNG